MLDGILCYRDAAIMLFGNIKAYISLVIINFPMLVIASNAARIDGENREFAISELLTTGIPKLQMLSLGAGINFVLFSFYIFLLTMSFTFGGSDTMIAFLAFIMIAETGLANFIFIYVAETIKLRNFKTSYNEAKISFHRDPKLIWGFMPVSVLLALTMCYLVYDFADAFSDIAAVMSNSNAAIDMQHAVLHAMLSAIMLVLLNTLSLAAKGMLVRRIRIREKEASKYIA